MSEEILQPNTPVKFAARNMRPRFRRLKAGDIFLVEMECEEAVWNQLRTVPDNALLENVMWFHDGDPDPNAKPETPEKPPKEPAGPYGQYWRSMFTKSFWTWAELHAALDCGSDAEQVKHSLHVQFETESLTTIGPRVWEAWVTEQGLPEGLITLSRNAEQQAAAKEN